MFDPAAGHRHLRHRSVHSRHPVTDRTALRVGIVAIILVIVSALFATPAHATRIKEVAAVQGVRSNQLIGYGLVIGLDGTGDQTTQAPFTTQGLQSMLQQLGVTLPPGTTMQLKNVAAVIVTDRLPCATAHGASVTAWFITMEPVRAFITILAAGAVRSMFRFSRSARKPTRWSASSGALTLTTRPSSARAVPAPLLALMALATARAVA